jgi:hypothetical protein
MAHDLASSNDRVPTMDTRRHVLLKVNALVAERAKLPPKPDLEKQVYQDVGINLKSYAEGVIKDLSGTKASSQQVAEQQPQS